MQISRRDFIKGIGIVGASLLLGCSSKPAEMINRTVKNIENEIEKQITTTVTENEQPYYKPLSRYEANFPKFEGRASKFDLGFPDFPAYRLKDGYNYAIDWNDNPIPSNKYEKYADKVWYQDYEYPPDEIKGFVWRGTIIDATELVNEKPQYHPFHPDNPKLNRWREKESIFPRSYDELDMLELKKAKWLFERKMKGVRDFFGENVVNGAYMKAHLIIEKPPLSGFGHGGGFRFELPVLSVNPEDLDKKIYRTVLENAKKDIEHLDNEIVAESVLSAPTYLCLYDENHNGAFDDGGLFTRILKDTRRTIDIATTTPKISIKDWVFKKWHEIY